MGLHFSTTAFRFVQNNYHGAEILENENGLVVLLENVNDGPPILDKIFMPNAPPFEPPSSFPSS